jgi:hypothetical protein
MCCSAKMLPTIWLHLHSGKSEAIPMTKPHAMKTYGMGKGKAYRVGGGYWCIRVLILRGRAPCTHWIKWGKWRWRTSLTVEEEIITESCYCESNCERSERALYAYYLLNYHALKTYVGVEEYFHAFLTSVLDGGEWSVSCFDRFTSRGRVTGTDRLGWVDPRA